MRIVSANLNQRLGNPNTRSRVERWLDTVGPDLFLAQEPFNPRQNERLALAGYRLVSTSPLVSCWVAQVHASPTIIEHSDRWHEVSLSGVSVHNVYLSPDFSGERHCFVLATGEKKNSVDRIVGRLYSNEIGFDLDVLWTNLFFDDVERLERYA
jgi:hypothetical protein